MKPSILLHPLLTGDLIDEQSLQPALTLEQLLVNATKSSQINEDLLSNVIQYHLHLMI